MAEKKFASTKIRFCSLWRATARNGNTYIQGRVSDTMKLLIFQNSVVPGSGQAEFTAYLVPCRPRNAQRAEFPETLGVDVPPPLEPPEKEGGA